jgi:hypothetical protein
MKQVYPEMEVHDLTEDIKIKTPEELTKNFKKFIKTTIIKSIYSQQSKNGKCVLSEKNINKIKNNQFSKKK